MNNPRITKKEWGLLKGAIRRVFSRSELRAAAIAKSRIDHKDDKRPRVAKWSRCAECKEPFPTYLAEADHLDPVVPINTKFEFMNIDDFINLVWCVLDKIQILCHNCHKSKSSGERKERLKFFPKKKKGSKVHE